MTKDEIIKQRYPFYNSDISQKDIEINAEAAKDLMEAYFVDQLKRLVEDLEQLEESNREWQRYEKLYSAAIQRIKDEISRND